MAFPGYVALFNNTGDGLGIASAATVVDLDNRDLSIGTGTLDAAKVTVQDATTSFAKVDITGTLTDSVATAGGGPVGLFVRPTMNLSEDHASPGQLASVFVDPIATPSTGTQTLGAVHGVYVHSGSGAPAVAATAYGVYVKEPTVGTTNYSAYFEGKVGVKTATPTADLDVNGSISATTMNGMTMTPSGNPVAVGSANSAGVGTTYARLDHVHDHGTQAGGALHAEASGVAAGFMSTADKTKLDTFGTETNYMLRDGTRAMTGSLNLGTNAVINVTTLNGITMTPTGNPVAVGSANSAGVGTTYARLDHVHDHGTQAGGALHADATTIAAGFMSAADKVKLDGMVSTASFEQVSQNLGDWAKAFAYTGDDLTTITYTKLTDTIVKTFSYSGGKLNTIVLSGDTPGGIPLTKTFIYSGDTLTSVTYT